MPIQPIQERIPRRILYLIMLRHSLRHDNHVFRHVLDKNNTHNEPTCLTNHMYIANEQLQIPYTIIEMNRIIEIITMTLNLIILVREIREPTCNQIAILIDELIQASGAE